MASDSIGDHDAASIFLASSAGDLVGTIWTPDGLELAKAVYREIFTRLNEWSWCETPVGPLGVQWKSSGMHPTSFLTHVAHMAGSLLYRHATKKSVPVILEKFRALLRPGSDAAFYETLVEFEVANCIAQLISPISFEPMVPPSTEPVSTKPSSPDLGVRLPEGDVTIEVTTWHWQSIRRWHGVTREMRRQLMDRLSKFGTAYDIELRIPLESVLHTDVQAMTGPSVYNAILAVREGEITVPTSSGDAHIIWKPLPVFDSLDDWFRSGSSGAAVVGDGIARAGSCTVSPIFDESTLINAAKSLRKCIDRKRRQTVPGLTHLLVIAIEGVIKEEWVLPLIYRQVLPNPKYEWISALCLFVPRRNWELGPDSSGLRVCWNDKARLPAPPSLRAAFDHGIGFHLP